MVRLNFPVQGEWQDKTGTQFQGLKERDEVSIKTRGKNTQ